MAARKNGEKRPHHNELLKLRQQLKAEPRHHWLLTRLSSIYCAEGRHSLALRYAEKAFAEAASCPLVLWDYAGTLQMLERHYEALDSMRGS